MSIRSIPRASPLSVPSTDAPPATSPSTDAASTTTASTTTASTDTLPETAARRRPPRRASHAADAAAGQHQHKLQGPSTAKPGAKGHAPLPADLPPATRQMVEAEIGGARDPQAKRNLAALASDAAFGKLPEVNQQQMVRTLGRAPRDGQLLDDLRSMARDPSFRGLPQSVKNTALEQVNHFPGDTGPREIVSGLAKSSAFARLSEVEQNRMLHLVGGTNEELSRMARITLATRMRSDGYDAASVDGKTAQLRRYLDEQPGAPYVASGAAPPVHHREPYAVGPATDVPGFDFASGKADARRYDVDVAGQRIPVFMPAQPGPTNQTIEEITKSLAALPPASRALITSVSVNPGSNPADAFWRKQYNDPNFSTFMMAGSEGKVDVFNTPHWQDQSTLDATFIHETGHTMSFRAWGSDVADPRWQGWKDAIASDGLVPSRYARNNAQEDFSESLLVYQDARGTPREAELRGIMPRRFEMLDALLGNR